MSLLADLGCTNIEWGARGADTDAAEKPIGDEGLKAKDFAVLAAALQAIPNNKLDYESWISLTHAAKAGCGGDPAFLEGIYIPWCLKYPGNTEDVARAKWDSVTASTIGADYVFAQARAYGFYDTSGFDTPASNDGTKAAVEPLHPWLEEINQRYFLAQDGARVAVCELAYDPEMEREVLIRQQPRDFVAFWQNKRLPGYKKNIGRTWLEHPQRRTFARIAFLPGKEAPQGTFNLWRGFAVDPKPGNCTLFRNFMLEVICDGGTVRYDYLWNWMARAVQFPDEPGMVAPVLRGRQRTGKGFFANQFGQLFGPHFMAVSNGQHLVGKHNAHLENVCVLFCDEALFAGDRSIVGPLKSLITEKWITIEPKFFDARQAKNRLKVIMASNEDHVIGADRSGEAKRFFVTDVSGAHERDKPYFRAITKQMDEGGAEALLHELLNTDLSGFDVEQVPTTEALVEQKLASLDDVAQWWRDVLYRGDLPTTTVANDAGNFSDEPGWLDETTIEISHLYGAYVHWAEKRRPRNVIKCEQDFGKWMARVLKGETLSKSRPWNGGKAPRPWLYTLPSLDRCRRAFERFLEGPIPWPKDEPEKPPNK